MKIRIWTVWLRFHKDLSDTEKKIDSTRLPPAAALAADSMDLLAVSKFYFSAPFVNYLGSSISCGFVSIIDSPLALVMKSSGWRMFMTRMSGERPNETLDGFSKLNFKSKPYSS